MPRSSPRPSDRQPCRPRAISVCISASFFFTSWFGGQRLAELLAVQRVLAGAVPAILRAPITPQAMPKRALLRQENGPPRPLAFGNIFSAGTSTFSSTISPVIERAS